MLDFVFILLIILEIILSAICVKYLIELEKKVIQIDKKLVIKGNELVETLKQTRENLSKINRFISIFKNKRFLLITKILKTSLNAIQIILLVKSLDISKGLKKINYQTIKKLLYAEIIRKVLIKAIDFIKIYGSACSVRK